MTMGLMEEGAQEGGNGHELWSTHSWRGGAQGLPVLASPPHSTPPPDSIRHGPWSLSLCRASCLTQPPGHPQFSLTGVLMFKRAGAGGGCERLVAGKELASVSAESLLLSVSWDLEMAVALGHEAGSISGLFWLRTAS